MKVKVRTNHKLGIPKAIINKLNMNDTKRVCIVAYDSETFFIKKQFNISDIKSFFIDICPVVRRGYRWHYYYITIPPDLMRKMPSIKIGGYVYVYININKDIVVTTIPPIDFSKK